MTSATTRDPGSAVAPADEPAPLVEMRGIEKRFPGVRALAGVDFELRSGEVHALLGENGAGKTTLMGILMGLVTPDAGALRIAGNPARPRSPRDALGLGIGMVHQRLLFSERHSALDNIVLGWAELGRVPRRAALRARVEAATKRFGLELSDALDAPMHTLPVGTRQKVEIARALLRGARVLVLDEPTAVLSRQETHKLFELIRGFCRDGGGVVFISHKLEESLELADRITVLRRGRRVATHRAREIDAAALAVELIGQGMSKERGDATGAAAADATAGAPGLDDNRPGDARLALVAQLEAVSVSGDGIAGAGGLRQVSLHLAPGEVVGIAGVAGSGQTALAELLAGLRYPSGGRFELFGQTRGKRECHPGRFAAQGVAYIPADRDRTGIAGSLSVAENLLLRRYRRDFSRRGLLSWRRAQAFARSAIQSHAIACPGPGTRAGSLSGGNQQKVIVARELFGQPRLIIAAYPFRGLDIGAASGVRERLLAARQAGAAVVLISEDIDQLVAMSDRIAVLFRGAVLGVVSAARATAETVGLWMGGQTEGLDTAGLDTTADPRGAPTR